MQAIVAVGMPPSIREPQLYLTVVLASRIYAISIEAVKEIVSYRMLTALPRMPDHMRGVIERCGAAVPVIDLASRLEQARGKVTRRTCIVVAEVALAGASLDVGMVVDGASEVVEILSEHIEALPPRDPGLAPCVTAVAGGNDERSVRILDVDTVLSPSDLTTLRQAAVAGREASATAA
ncbi:MAG TPA: chemotaxis protein CheW [Rhodocyclaceae bacterium]|nr:chemotaxis protein CheW [Rhodocyclaceae bacterium]